MEPSGAFLQVGLPVVSGGVNALGVCKALPLSYSAVKVNLFQCGTFHCEGNKLC